MPQATSLAASIRERLGVDCELIRGAGGIFDVAIDGEPIFSKHESGRFPSDDEILAALQGRA